MEVKTAEDRQYKQQWSWVDSIIRGSERNTSCRSITGSIGNQIKKPITVKVDNMGTIFMSKNTTQTKRTKHVDVRANFIYEHVDEETRICEVVFVRSEENKSDIFTKNMSAEILKKHTEYVGTEEDVTGGNKEVLLDHEAREGVKNGSPWA